MPCDVTCSADTNQDEKGVAAAPFGADSGAFLTGTNAELLLLLFLFVFDLRPQVDAEDGQGGGHVLILN